MVSAKFGRFLVLAAVLVTGAFALAAALTPPDPYTQIVVLAVLVPVALAGSYVLSCRMEFDLR